MNEKELDYFIIVHKIDTVSGVLNRQLLKERVKKFLNSQTIVFNNLTAEKIFLVSSKTKEGISRLIDKLKDKSKELRSNNI